MSKSIFNLVTIPSALIAAILIGIWCHSQSIDSSHQYLSVGSHFHVSARWNKGDGAIVIFNDARDGPYFGRKQISSASMNFPTMHKFAFPGIDYWQIDRSNGTSIWTVQLHMVLMVFLLAMPITFQVLQWRFKKGPIHNRLICTACGYDLRATPDRCPECGTAYLSVAPVD